jgi:hypothetical protein
MSKDGRHYYEAKAFDLAFHILKDFDGRQIVCTTILPHTHFTLPHLEQNMLFAVLTAFAVPALAASVSSYVRRDVTNLNQFTCDTASATAVCSDKPNDTNLSVQHGMFTGLVYDSSLTSFSGRNHHRSRSHCFDLPEAERAADQGSLLHPIHGKQCKKNSKYNFGVLLTLRCSMGFRSLIVPPSAGTETCLQVPVNLSPTPDRSSSRQVLWQFCIMWRTMLD